MGAEHQQDRVLPVAAVDTDVGDRGLHGGADVHGLGDEVGGERPDESGHPGRVRAARGEVALDQLHVLHHALVRQAVRRTAEELGLGPQEEVQQPEVHPPAVQGVAGVGLRVGEVGLDVALVRVLVGALRCGEGEDAEDPVGALGAVVAQPPEPADGEDEGARLRLVAIGDGAREGRPDVVELGLQAGDPRELVP